MKRPAVLLTGVGKRYDIVSSFARLTFTVAFDPNPFAPARYAAQLAVGGPPFSDPRYLALLEALCAEHRVGAVLPLTDLDIALLADAAAEGRLPALVPPPATARATFDKYAAHNKLLELGLPSPPTALPEGDLEALRYPVVVKPRWGSGARSVHLARSPAEARFFIDYLEGRPHFPEPLAPPPERLNADVRAPRGEAVMVQTALGGQELAIDCLADWEGRCLNAIPRLMLESRGGESIKGTVVEDKELVELGRLVVEGLGVRGPATVQCFRDPTLGLRITDVNTRFGGAFPAPAYAAYPGHTYPELIVALAEGKEVSPHLGRYRAPLSFTRYYWQLELDRDLKPTGRELVEGGPRRPAGCNNGG